MRVRAHTCKATRRSAITNSPGKPPFLPSCITQTRDSCNRIPVLCLLPPPLARGRFSAVNYVSEVLPLPCYVVPFFHHARSRSVPHMSHTAAVCHPSQPTTPPRPHPTATRSPATSAWLPVTSGRPPPEASDEPQQSPHHPARRHATRPPLPPRLHPRPRPGNAAPAACSKPGVAA